MGRIRTMKPEFPQSESLGAASRSGADLAAAYRHAYTVAAAALDASSDEGAIDNVMAALAKLAGVE